MLTSRAVTLHFFPDSYNMRGVNMMCMSKETVSNTEFATAAQIAKAACPLHHAVCHTCAGLQCSCLLHQVVVFVHSFASHSHAGCVQRPTSTLLLALRFRLCPLKSAMWQHRIPVTTGSLVKSEEVVCTVVDCLDCMCKYVHLLSCHSLAQISLGGWDNLVKAKKQSVIFNDKYLAHPKKTI